MGCIVMRLSSHNWRRHEESCRLITTFVLSGGFVAMWASVRLSTTVHIAVGQELAILCGGELAPGLLANVGVRPVKRIDMAFQIVAPCKGSVTIFAVVPNLCLVFAGLGGRGSAIFLNLRHFRRFLRVCGSEEGFEKRIPLMWKESKVGGILFAVVGLRKRRRSSRGLGIYALCDLERRESLEWVTRYSRWLDCAKREV